MGDRQRLQQKIIAELGDILDDPQAGSNAAAPVADADAQAPAPVPAAQQEQPVQQETVADGAAPHRVSVAGLADDTTHNQNNNPSNTGPQLKLPMGMAKESTDHADPSMEEKRLKVKEVSLIFQ